MRHAARTTRLAAALLLLAFPAFPDTADLAAVPRSDPAWSVDLESPVHWQAVTPLGTLLVLTDGGLTGVDAASGEAAWTVSGPAAAPETGCRMLPGTPLLVVPDTGAGKMRILDSTDGRVVFDSERAGFASVTGSHVLSGGSRLLVLGVPLGRVTGAMALFDVASGDRLWMNENVGGGSSGLLAALAALLDVSEQLTPPRQAPLELDGGTLLVDAGGGLMKVDAATGEVLFTLPYGERFFLDPHGRDAVYVGGGHAGAVDGAAGPARSVWRAFRPSDGTAIWSGPVRLQGTPSDPVFLEGGILLGSRAGGGEVRYVDPESGRPLWGENGGGIEIRGGVVEALRTAAGVVLVTGDDGARTGKAAVHHLNVLDEATGAPRFPKAHRMKGALRWIEELPEGLLYVTTGEMNILDLTTGEPRYHRSILAEGGLVTAQDGASMYAFSTGDGLLHRVDRDSSTIEAVSTSRVVLQDDDAPIALEARPDGLLLISGQSLVSFGRDGSLRFHAHYPPPRRPGWVRSPVSPDFVFMMVRLSHKELGLARVSKATGEIEGMIQVQRDRAPHYQVDGASHRVFYRRNGSEIRCYRF